MGLHSNLIKQLNKDGSSFNFIVSGFTVSGKIVSVADDLVTIKTATINSSPKVLTMEVHINNVVVITN